MPGMNSGLNADDPTVAAVFCAALLHQGLIIAVIFAVLSIAWVAVRRPGGGAASRAAVPEPAGRRVLRIGFGLRRREGACRVSRPAASPAATRRQRHGGRHELAGRLARRLGWFWRGRAAAAAAAAGLTVVACGGPAPHHSGTGQPRPPEALGGVVMNDPVPTSIARLPLTTASGQRTTLAAYRGKIVMIADFLTLCQDMCPMISANTIQVARRVQAAGLDGKIALLEITVDPQRDTPARLAAYQKMFGGPRPDWTLATATTAAGTAALWNFFHVYYHRQPEDDADATDWLTGRKLTYDVEHSNTLIFMSPDGKLRYLTDAAADTQGSLPPSALVRFMDSQGRRNLYHPNPGDSWTVPQALQVLGWLNGHAIPAGRS